MALAQLKDLKHIPGSTGLPIFGDLFKFLSNASEYLSNCQEKYGDVFKSHTLLGTSVVITGPTANKLILVEGGKFTSNQEAWEMSLSDLFPNGLMLMDGERHQYHRSIMNEAFKKDPMQGYIDVMPDIISETIAELDGKDKVVFFPFIKKLTLRLAATVFFGLNPKDDLTKINKAITDVVDASLALRIKLPGTKYSNGIKGRSYLVSYFKSIIAERRQNPGKDLFSRFCQAKSDEGNQFTDQEIIDHLIFVLMASHDTTAITLTMMSYFLAKHPEWQDKVREESNLVGRIEGVTSLDLRKLVDTGLVMKESLRIHPPLIMVARKLEKDLVVDDIKIPKSTSVNVVFQLTHHDDRVWTNSNRFDPDRFSSERKEQLKCPFAYAPFGAGKHHCIGYAFAEAQVKLIVTELVRRFHISVPEGYVCPVVDVPLKHPKDGLPLYLKPV